MYVVALFCKRDVLQHPVLAAIFIGHADIFPGIVHYCS